MSGPRLSELLAVDPGLCGDDPEITGLASDSRELRPGDLFLACRGSESHGLAYLEQALARGAAAVAWEPGARYGRPDCACPAVAVPQLSREAGVIAARFYGQPSRSLFTMGVTGTDGKTSCVHLAAQAAAGLGRRCGMLGTLGFGFLDDLHAATHTTPDPVALQRWIAQLRDAGADSLAMEVSSHALDQGRIAGVELNVAVYTNLSRDHLDYHGDLHNYARAKRRLLELEGLDAALINIDDDLGRAWAAELADRCPVVPYAVDAQPEGERWLRAEDVSLDPEGLRCTIRTPDEAVALESGLIGRFNVYNLLAVAGAWREAGLPLAEIAAALSQAVTVPGRIEAFREDGAPLVVVDYAHTPGALAQVLDALNAHRPTGGRVICVFGCGGNRDRGKRGPMTAAAAARADVLLLTDDNPRFEAPADIIADMLEGMPRGQEYCVIHDRATAIEQAIRRARPQDIVLVAGKGHEDYQQVGDERRPFSDRQQVARCLGAEEPACSA